VSLVELVDRWEGPFLTLPSQKRPTLSRRRRANIEKAQWMRQPTLSVVVDTRFGPRQINTRSAHPFLSLHSPLDHDQAMQSFRDQAISYIKRLHRPLKAPQPRTTTDTSTCQPLRPTARRTTCAYIYLRTIHSFLTLFFSFIPTEYRTPTTTMLI
jgi:hypothetical protein